MANSNEFSVRFEGDASSLIAEINKLQQSLAQLNTNVTTQTANVANNTKNMASSMSLSFGSISRILAGAGIVIGLQQIGNALRETLGASSELETVRTTFRVFTGSVETADKVLSDLKTTALESPLNFQDFVQGARTLMGYGVSAEQVTPIVKQLGDISGGSADRFKRLSLAFGQVVGAGRLMGQEARQMINAGFNPLQFIAEKTGKSMGQLSREMRNGQISVQDVADAFTTATSEGGRFYGLSEEITNTLGGQFNKLKESLFFTLAEIGDEFAKTFDLKGAITGLANFIDYIKPSIVTLFKTVGESEMFSLLKDFLTLLPPIIKYLIDFQIQLFKLADAITRVTVSGLTSFFEGLNWVLKESVGFIDKMLKGITELVTGVDEIQTSDLMKLTPEQINAFDKNSKKFGESLKTGVSLKELESGKKNIEGLLDYANKNFIKLPPIIEESAKQIQKFNKNAEDLEAKDTLNKIVLKIKKSLVSASKEIRDAIDEINKPFKDAQAQLDKYIGNTVDTISKSILSKKDQLIFDETTKYKQLINLAKIYGLDMAVVTMAYQANVNSIEKKFREENLQDSKKHADSLIGIVQKQAKAQSDIMMKLSGVSGKVNLDQLVDNTILTRFETFTSSLYATVNDFAQQTPALFGQALGEMLVDSVSFSDAIDNLGSIMLSAFGKLLQQLGSALITLGVSSEAFQKAIATMFTPGNPGSGVAAIVAGTALVAAGAAFSKLASATGSSKNTGSKVAGSLQRTMASGQTYQYGGANYSMQSIKLSIDLTGSITASPTGYNISKQYETIARVTGR